MQECVSKRTTYKDKCTLSGNWACWGSSIDDMVDIAVNDFFRIVGGVGWKATLQVTDDLIWPSDPGL